MKRVFNHFELSTDKGNERSLFKLCYRIYIKASFQPDWAPHSIIVIRPLTVPDQAMNLGPLS